MSSADFHCWRPIVINFQNLHRSSFDNNGDRINGFLKLRGTNGSTNHEPTDILYWIRAEKKNFNGELLKSITQGQP